MSHRRDPCIAPAALAASRRPLPPVAMSVGRDLARAAAPPRRLLDPAGRRVGIEAAHSHAHGRMLASAELAAYGMPVAACRMDCQDDAAKPAQRCGACRRLRAPPRRRPANQSFRAGLESAGLSMSHMSATYDLLPSSRRLSIQLPFFLALSMSEGRAWTINVFNASAPHAGRRSARPRRADGPVPGWTLPLQGGRAPDGAACAPHAPTSKVRST